MTINSTIKSINQLITVPLRPARRDAIMRAPNVKGKGCAR